MELSQRIQAVISGADDGWSLYYRARAMQEAGDPVVMLTIGDHDIKTDPSILDAMKASMDAGNLGYSSVMGSDALRDAIASRVTARTASGAARENIIVTPGGQAALFASLMAVLDPGQSCVILDPFYATFAQTVRSVGGRAILVETPVDQGFQPDIAAIVKKTVELVQQTIDIPRIQVAPKGDVASGFHAFELELSGLNYPAVSDELWQKSLVTGKIEVIGLGKGGMREARLEDYVVSGLVDFDDIAYAQHADLLYDLAGQVVTHICGYLSEEEAHKVLRCHQREVAQFLIDQGANVNAPALDQYRGTPLHWAAALGRLEMARQLIDAGANVNVRDENGYTPLDATALEQFSKSKTRLAVAELLRQRGGKSRDEQVNP